ncbi:MAG: hypothetical protein AB1633_02285 [Elusimicrobiota bacterium]
MCEEKNNNEGQDLTLALLVATAFATLALITIIKVSNKKFSLDIEAIRKAYSGIMQPEDYTE